MPAPAHGPEPPTPGAGRGDTHHGQRGRGYGGWTAASAGLREALRRTQSRSCGSWDAVPGVLPRASSGGAN